MLPTRILTHLGSWSANRRHFCAVAETCTARDIARLEMLNDACDGLVDGGDPSAVNGNDGTWWVLMVDDGYDGLLVVQNVRIGK